MADCIGKKKSTAKYVFDELLDRGLIEYCQDSTLM